MKDGNTSNDKDGNTSKLLMLMGHYGNTGKVKDGNTSKVKTFADTLLNNML